MPKTYAIADLHGRHDLLTGAINAISDVDQGPLTFVTLGDYIDRGPDSAKVISTLMVIRANPPTGWNVICLKGNHEAMMVETLRTPLSLDWWLGNGGDATLFSYGDDLSGGNLGPKVVPDSHIDWIDGLPLVYLDPNRIFVHAGVIPGKSLEDHSADTLTWMLYPSGADEDFFGRHIVHGHHQFGRGPMLYKGRTNLDVFAWQTGRLVIGVFDDEVPGGPVELIEVFGNGEWRRIERQKGSEK